MMDHERHNMRHKRHKKDNLCFVRYFVIFVVNLCFFRNISLLVTHLCEL
jgi:hypothetical protein